MWEEVFNAAFSAAAQMADAFAHAAFAQYHFAKLQSLEMAQFGAVHDHRPILGEMLGAIEDRVIGHRLAPIH